MKTKLRQQRQDSAHKPVEKPTSTPVAYSRPELADFADELYTNRAGEWSSQAIVTPEPADPEIPDEIAEQGAAYLESIHEKRLARSTPLAPDTFTRRYNRAKAEALKRATEPTPPPEPEQLPPTPRKSGFWDAVRTFFWGL